MAHARKTHPFQGLKAKCLILVSHGHTSTAQLSSDQPHTTNRTYIVAKFVRWREEHVSMVGLGDLEMRPHREQSSHNSSCRSRVSNLAQVSGAQLTSTSDCANKLRKSPNAFHGPRKAPSSLYLLNTSCVQFFPLRWKKTASSGTAPATTELKVGGT